MILHVATYVHSSNTYIAMLDYSTGSYTKSWLEDMTTKLPPSISVWTGF